MRGLSWFDWTDRRGNPVRRDRDVTICDMTPRRAAPFLVAVAAVLLAVAGCSSKGSSAAASAPAPAPSGIATASGTPSGLPTASPSPAAPPSCRLLLPLFDLDKAVGKPLVGRTEFVVGQPEPKIHRTGRLTCRYGVQPVPGAKSGAPKLELGISTYTDVASAAARVRTTVTSAREQGATPRPVTVGGQPATILISGSTKPTLVAAVGVRTVAATLTPGTVAGAREPAVLTAVTELALSNLGG